ncbi:MAG: IPT/TIG domain-containing protein [Myxococcales bacterium]|nr:IPT/TIG domain-containing protein [Myxococcales bacterium]
MRVLPTATATLVYLFVFHLQAHAACTPTEITSAVIWNSNMALTGDCGVRILNGGSLQINAGVTVTVGATLQNRPAIEVYGGQLVIKGTNPSRVTFVGESGFTGVFIEADQDGSSNAPTLDVAYTEFNGDIGAPLGPRGITVSYVGVKGNPVAWKGLTMANLYSGLEVANTAAIKVVDSQFSNIAEQAISVGTASEVYVQRSTFSGMFAGILGWQTGAIKEVIGCTFKEVGRKNPTDNNGWAIRSTVDGLSGVTISNNVILMDAEAIGAIEFKIISNATIEHNTIAAAVGLSDSPSNGTAVRIVSIGSPLTFSGNLLWGWTRGFDADFEGGVTVRMNAAYHSICGFYDRVQDNCDSNSWLNVYWGPGNTWRLDPKFRDLLGGDLRLQPDSPFIDIVDAADATLPGTDPDGNPRLLGQYDLGAYESPLLDPIDDAFVYLPRDGKVRTIVLTGHNLKAEYTSVEILTTDGQLDPKVTVKPKSIQDIGAQPTHLRLNVVAATDAEPGERWVRVKNNPNDPGFILKTVGEKKSLFVARVPTVTTVEPNVGQPGQTLHLTITGTDFPDTVGEVDLDIGGLPLTVDSVESNTTIKATLQLPESATLASYNVTLTNRSGGASHTLSAGFTVEKKTPMVANITPTKGVVGHSYDVIITGQSFDDSADPTVSFGADTNTVVKVRTEKQLTVTVTITGAATPGMRSLTVTNPDGGTVSVSNAFEVQANTPPSTPELDLMPGLTVSNDGTITLTQTPTDDTPIPGDPTLTYTCVYSTNSDLSAPVEITSSTDGTCAPDTSKLTEDVVYYVQVTVKDADGAESTSTPGQLLYSAVNHAPSTPLPQTPSDDTVLNDTMVSFTFSSASDPEQESITYRLQVSQKGSAFPLIDLAGIAATTDPIQTVALTEALEEDVIYTWRVQAVDPHGKASAWSA